jgi:predicted phage terminase large subunit-like protein
VIQTPYGTKRFERRAGEPLHAEREGLTELKQLREVLGEYNFAGQYQQAPAPLGGGLVKAEWFQTYTEKDRPEKFNTIFQSWDTANKPGELNDFSVCTTWGVREKHIYLLHVFRKKLAYPELKRAVQEQAEAFGAQTVLIEDKASGTQLIQELVAEGMHAVKGYKPTAENKIMRMHSVTPMIANGFVYLPEKAFWLGEYLHELTIFPNGKFDDQADSTSQALDFFKNSFTNGTQGLIEYFKRRAMQECQEQSSTIPESRPCPNCSGVMNQRIPDGLRCINCGVQWPAPGLQPCAQHLTRKDILERPLFGRFGGANFRRRF